MISQRAVVNTHLKDELYNESFLLLSKKSKKVAFKKDNLSWAFLKKETSF